MDNVKGELTDILFVLPLNVLEDIFSYLNIEDLLSCSLVSVSCYNIHNQNKIWKRHCSDNEWTIFSNSYLSIDKDFCINTRFKNSSPFFTFTECKESTRLNYINNWKLLYMKVNHLMKNWAKGKYRIEMVVNKSKEAIQCIDVDDHCIIHGKEDGAVELIDLEDSMRCVSLQNPTGIAATNIKIQGEQVFVAFINGELKLFDFDGVLVLEYRGCTENHDILTTNAFRVISVVASRQILIWNINSSELLHKLNIHEEDIEMIAIYNDMIMTSDWNKKLILTDIKTGATIHDIFTEGEILCCKFDYKIVVTGSSESLVKLWFTTDMVPMFTMSGHEAEIYCVTYNDDIVISGSADSTIRIWSMFGICQMVLNGHIGVVRALHLDQFKLVSYGDQTRIIIWDCKKFKKLEVLYRNPYLISKFFVNFKHITTLSPDSQITKFSYW